MAYIGSRCQYQFRVSARNRAGSSEPTTSNVVVTDETLVPPTPAQPSIVRYRLEQRAITI